MEWPVVCGYHCLKDVEPATEQPETGNIIIHCITPLVRGNALNPTRGATFFLLSFRKSY